MTIDTSLAQANEVEMILIPDDAPPRQSERFVLMPERAANNQPADEGGDPIAASLFNSRAADELSGGNETTPSASEASDIQQMEIRKDNPSGSEGVALENQPSPMAPQQPSGAVSGEEAGDAEDQSGEEQDNLGRWAIPDEKPESGAENKESQEETQEDSPQLEDWWGADSPTLLKEGDEGPAGDRGFDFNQQESGTQGSGVAYVGNYSMNTYEWAFGPWMQKWVNQLHRHWKAPYAYSHLGMIHGKTLVKMVIKKNGIVESFEILDTEGHESLHEASEAALKAFAPYAALPSDFPEEYLVLTMELRYPALR